MHYFSIYNVLWSFFRLRIPSSGAYPNCGTEGYGDTQTNIVVVQHSELVQTSKDMIYNLTCTIQAPGESVVSSGYVRTQHMFLRILNFLFVIVFMFFRKTNWFFKKTITVRYFDSEMKI